MKTQIFQEWKSFFLFSSPTEYICKIVLVSFQNLIFIETVGPDLRILIFLCSGAKVKSIFGKGFIGEMGEPQCIRDWEREVHPRKKGLWKMHQILWRKCFGKIQRNIRTRLSEKISRKGMMVYISFEWVVLSRVSVGEGAVLHYSPYLTNSPSIDEPLPIDFQLSHFPHCTSAPPYHKLHKSTPR